MTLAQLEAWARDVQPFDHLAYVGKDITIADAKRAAVELLDRAAAAFDVRCDECGAEPSLNQRRDPGMRCPFCQYGVMRMERVE